MLLLPLHAQLEQVGGLRGLGGARQHHTICGGRTRTLGLEASPPPQPFLLAPPRSKSLLKAPPPALLSPMMSATPSFRVLGVAVGDSSVSPKSKRILLGDTPRWVAMWSTTLCRGSDWRRREEQGGLPALKSPSPPPTQVCGLCYSSFSAGSFSIFTWENTE